VESSLLAQIGRFFEPVGRPIGLDWKMITALLTSIMAKENAIATLAVLYGARGAGTDVRSAEGGEPSLRPGFPGGVDALVPCVATVTAMKREMEDWKWFTASLILMLTVSLFGGMIIYHVALVGWIIKEGCQELTSFFNSLDIFLLRGLPVIPHP